MVLLKGLAAKPENNGRRGHILHFSKAKERYVVKLLAGAEVNVKAHNLDLVDEPAIAAVSEAAPAAAAVPMPAAVAWASEPAAALPVAGTQAAATAAAAGPARRWSAARTQPAPSPHATPRSAAGAPAPVLPHSPAALQAALARAIAASNPVDILTALAQGGGRGRSRSRSQSPAEKRCQPADRAKDVVLAALPALLSAHASVPSPWSTELRSLRLEGTAREPRGAGIIAFRLPAGPAGGPGGGLCVCIVEKAPKWTCPGCKAHMYDTWMECSGCSQPRPRAMARFAPGDRARGLQGFPKGGREPVDRGCVWANALREWDQETGIARDRLQIVPNKHFDDTAVGARFLLGLCSSSAGAQDEPPAAGGLGAGAAGEASWQPPEANLTCPGGHPLRARRASRVAAPRCGGCSKQVPGHGAVLHCDLCSYSMCKDCQDPDPILVAHWMHVDRARRQLSDLRRNLLDRAIRALPTPLRGARAP